MENEDACKQEPFAMCLHAHRCTCSQFRVIGERVLL